MLYRTIILIAFVFMINIAYHELARAQFPDEPGARVQIAASCLRKIPGLIEGQTDEDLINDNAHFVVMTVRKGRIDFPRTFIRLHPGVSRGLLPGIDQSQVMACMRGLRRRP